MKFEIITIFPDIFRSYLKESLIKKALKKRLLSINVHNLRNWAKDRHRTVDDRPFGGGLGMVMKVEPIYKAVNILLKKQKLAPYHPSRARIGAGSKIIFFTPRGKKFNQKIAYSLSKLNHLILICGRYEGVDERVAKNIADLKLSIGDYDLMGGELPAMVVIETIARLIPGVIGKKEFLKQRILKGGGFVEYEQYTRPEIFVAEKTKKWPVPKVLISGDHKKIEEWRKKHSKNIGK